MTWFPWWVQPWLPCRVCPESFQWRPQKNPEVSTGEIITKVVIWAFVFTIFRHTHISIIVAFIISHESPPKKTCYHTTIPFWHPSRYPNHCWLVMSCPICPNCCWFNPIFFIWSPWLVHIEGILYCWLYPVTYSKKCAYHYSYFQDRPWKITKVFLVNHAGHHPHPTGDDSPNPALVSWLVCN